MAAASGFWIGLFVVGTVQFVLYVRMEKFLKCTFFTAFTGLLALGVVWLLGNLFAVALTLTPFSVAASGILGVPGVVTMLLLGLL